MDCWTVNMLQPQTAVLLRVKCDGWVGEQGDIWKWPGTKGKGKSVRLCFTNPPTTPRQLPLFIPLFLPVTWQCRLLYFQLINICVAKILAPNSNWNSSSKCSCFPLEVTNIDQKNWSLNSLGCIYHSCSDICCLYKRRQVTEASWVVLWWQQLKIRIDKVDHHLR